VGNPFKSPAVISFCPGILGIERGLKRAGVHPRVVAYVEIEAYIIANLVAGMEAGVLDPAPIWTDAKTFDARPFRGRIHGIIGGYPCTPFSLAGTRSGENHPGHIYPAISRAIETTRPVWCYFENVDDHLTLGFDKVYQDLQRMGYAVEAGIYTAEEVGAPHERQRLFILAIANRFDWGLSETNEWFESLQASRRRKDNFPARPGEQQHDWEEPRTVKSGMGCTINGYNFREDLLRALGNAVVEQTTEIAFIDLLQKHLRNVEK
jgi:site-specific DNA-cytosine methylase